MAAWRPQQFWPAGRALGANGPFKEAIRCQKAPYRLAGWALISTATDRGSSYTNQISTQKRSKMAWPCLRPVGSAAVGALRFLHHLSAKTHRRAFATAELACKWPPGAVRPAAALLRPQLWPAKRAFAAPGEPSCGALISTATARGSIDR